MHADLLRPGHRLIRLPRHRVQDGPLPRAAEKTAQALYECLNGVLERFPEKPLAELLIRNAEQLRLGFHDGPQNISEQNRVIRQGDNELALEGPVQVNIAGSAYPLDRCDGDPQIPFVPVLAFESGSHGVP